MEAVQEALKAVQATRKAWVDSIFDETPIVRSYLLGKHKAADARLAEACAR